MASDWYAVRMLGRSVEEVKEFLFPFDRGVWLRLAVIVFFVGGSASFQPPLGSDGAAQGSGLEAGGFQEAVGGADPGALLASPLFIGVILAVLGLVVVWSYFSAVFELVFYRTLKEGEPRLRRGVRRYARVGFGYFLFNWGVLLVGGLGAVAVVLALMVFGSAYAAVLGLVLLPVWVGLWLVSFYVSNLAVPAMAVEGVGFVEGVQGAYRQVRAEWRQAAVFFVVRFVVGIVAATVVGIGTLLVLVALAIPLGIVGFLLYMLHPVLVVIPLVVGLAGLFVAWFAVSIPVQTFVYRWVLNVYGAFAG